MNWAGHALVGMAVCFAVFSIAGIEINPWAISVSALFAVLPDIDLKKSIVNRAVSAFCGILLGIYAYAKSGSVEIGLFGTVIGYLIYWAIWKAINPRHRGITHTKKALVIVSLAMWVILGPEYSLATFAGYGSHLATDKLL